MAPGQRLFALVIVPQTPPCQLFTEHLRCVRYHELFKAYRGRVSLYTRNLSFRRLWCPQRSWGDPHGRRGQLNIGTLWYLSSMRRKTQHPHFLTPPTPKACASHCVRPRSGPCPWGRGSSQHRVATVYSDAMRGTFHLHHRCTCYEPLW
jgi:hypothetical protein